MFEPVTEASATTRLPLRRTGCRPADGQQRSRLGAGGGGRRHGAGPAPSADGRRRRLGSSICCWDVATAIVLDDDLCGESPQGATPHCSKASSRSWSRLGAIPSICRWCSSMRRHRRSNCPGGSGHRRYRWCMVLTDADGRAMTVSTTTSGNTHTAIRVGNGDGGESAKPVAAPRQDAQPASRRNTRAWRIRPRASVWLSFADLASGVRRLPEGKWTAPDCRPYSKRARCEETGRN